MKVANMSFLTQWPHTPKLEEETIFMNNTYLNEKAQDTFVCEQKAECSTYYKQ